MLRELDLIRKDLKDRNIQAVAKATGLHPNSLYVFMKEQGKPKYETILKIEKYLLGGADDE